MNLTYKKRIGNVAENIALKYLLKQGLTLVKSQYRTRYGEIDLIMRQDKDLVFVEVRYRENTDLMLPEESISMRKRKRIISTAKIFYQSNPGFAGYNIRFDVIGISGKQLDLKITWICNAFETSNPI